MVKRIEYLVDDLQVNPSNIMAITFTNKAAGEIRDRVAAVSNEAGKMWIGTFHSICVRLIRMFGDHMGVSHFNILDTNDSKNLIKSILDKRGVSYTPFEINAIRSKISSYKNNLIRPAAVLADRREKDIIAEVYQEYQNVCWKNKTFDFDDLIIYGLLLLSSYPEVSNWIHENIKYLMVDECQDSNSAQFQLVKLIAGDNNIMLIGDANQSIYAFRDAKPQYLENFASSHPNTKVMKLEKNYRSTKTIIDAANEIIKNNNFGTKVSMFCDQGEGEKIQLCNCLDSRDEAKWIVSEILTGTLGQYKDIAIIYRANYQSRILEQELNASGVPYAIFGGMSFFQRKEVKDLLAFLKVYINHDDIESFRRALKTLKGVGDKTVEAILNILLSEPTVSGAIDALDFYLANGKRITSYVKDQLKGLKKVLESKADRCSLVLENIYTYTSYRDELKAIMTDESQERLDNMDEFAEMLRALEEKGATMEESIDQVSLLSETKKEDKEKMNAVKLMTAHASKGLEFGTVFVVGMEEEMFPHSNAINAGTEEAIEEERRLFYVAMTRAKKKLYLTRARQKYRNEGGGTYYCTPSRFLDEIPSKYTEEVW